MSNYVHEFITGETTNLPVGKAVCVGRNYADHAKEMGSQVPDDPMLFIKPATSLRALSEPVQLPGFSSDVHHELELTVLIEKTLCKSDAADVHAAIAGCGLGIDLTARDLQAQLKQKSHPWEKSKGFDGAGVLSPFIPIAEFEDLRDVDLELHINGQVRQSGNTRDMVFPVTELIVHISQYFTLLPGDVVMTGTPAGVGPLHPGDQLALSLAGRFHFKSRVGGP